MSAVIKTTTPFVVQTVLLSALSELGYEPVLITELNLNQYRQRGGLLVGDILTNRNDYWGRQYFRKVNHTFLLNHDSDEIHAQIISKQYTSKNYKPVASFLQELENEYAVQYQINLKHLAAIEREKLEEERVARVETTRRKVIAEAKAKGYLVKEKYVNGNIQLVCTRSV
ncbi:hypothetical protein [Neptunomonas qingdaonensis]|uniref:Uncharacterized protein n=1 Tax=Neptunomonas qingdaonensis TaxID=1045558 RepID=A0A1I2TTA2_9GAMM|nr:hypothetical protein [Neptunomonas qingdaonensis]SFG68165.1 hypothetical protein SAMN05216175_11110 [Neptunomonas qingdaonensis]